MKCYESTEESDVFHRLPKLELSMESAIFMNYKNEEN